MRSLYFIRARFVAAAIIGAVDLTGSNGVGAQAPVAFPPLQETGAFSFTTFFRGVPIGSEQVALTRSADGWTVAVSGRLGAPLDVLARRIEARYTADWKPIEFSFDG